MTQIKMTRETQMTLNGMGKRKQSLFDYEETNHGKIVMGYVIEEGCIHICYTRVFGETERNFFGNLTVHPQQFEQAYSALAELENLSTVFVGRNRFDITFI